MSIVIGAVLHIKIKLNPKTDVVQIINAETRSVAVHAHHMAVIRRRFAHAGSLDATEIDALIHTQQFQNCLWKLKFHVKAFTLPVGNVEMPQGAGLLSTYCEA